MNGVTNSHARNPDTRNHMAGQKGQSKKPATNGTAPAASAGPERLSAYFLSLSLENVRCFGAKQTLDLSDGHGKPAPWTIILGLNGTGKTTLLQSLVGFEVLTLPGQIAGSYPTAIRFFNILMRDYEGFHRTLDTNSHCIFGVDIALMTNLIALPHNTTPLVFEVNSQTTHLSFDEAIFKEVPNTPWCCAYGAGRRLGIASFMGSGSGSGSGNYYSSGYDDPTTTIFSDQENLRDPEEWLLQLDYARAREADDEHEQRDRLAHAKDLLLSVLPDIKDIRLAITKGPYPHPRAEFQTPYGWVPLRQLGYGYQTLITWVADLANRMAERYPDSNNPLAEPAVVLVDEIDLHLHPKWQRKLMSFLTERFPNTQFIATAHSPLVVQAAADANLAVLRREGDHVVIDNEVDNIRNWRIDQILTSDLFGLETARPPQIEALLLERKALLTKPKQTTADKRRLAELEAKIGELPMGETIKEIEDREKMLKLLESLEKERKAAQ